MTWSKEDTLIVVVFFALYGLFSYILDMLSAFRRWRKSRYRG